MTTPTLTVESTLTDRYQTTIPEKVRQFLGLSKRDHIEYRINANGEICLTKKVEEEVDATMASFLAFIDRDIQQHPEGVNPLSESLMRRTDALLAGMQPLDLSDKLSDADE